ncbi:MAG: PHP domain-containing protein [Oscillospiraceae bacterium]|nr:PHP domain-containing protein [Oscillospiraceae bacterium]
MKCVDLHTHSTCSDGTLTPSELAAEAKSCGLAAAALTDHDTVNGTDEFIRASERLGIEPVAGVEISAKYRTEMHIVGLMIDHKSGALVSRLEYLQKNRCERNGRVLELIQKNGMDISLADITGQKDGGGLENAGRAHIARALVEKGYASDMQDAFDKYLKKGRPCYIERITFPPRESIELIKNAGGAAVLAHPYYITRDRDELERLLRELAGYGLDGFECMYSDYPPEYRAMCMELADKTGLLKSGGSDFHAKNRPNVKLGYASDGERIPYEYLEKLRKRIGK